MEPQPLRNSIWTVEQLDAAVAAFAEYSVRKGQGERLTRREYYRGLARNNPRLDSAFKQAFYNIAYVLNRLGMRGVPGVTNTAPVGQETEQVLRHAILRTPYFRKFKTDLPPPPGNVRPGRHQETVTRIDRSQAIVDWVLAQAAGHCENCRQPAPFVNADDIPFLEVHHVKWLANGGSDQVTNAVALCPNCHREFHYGANAAGLAADIIEKVGRLMAE